MIHISGEIVNPGVYSLPNHSRLQDLVEAAGGLTDQADDSKINLVAILTDGQKIQVPAKLIQQDYQGASDPNGSAVVFYPIDLNTAGQMELESLPDIGPKTAQAILIYRDEHGPFKTVDELIEVPNIGPATLSKIQDLVTVNP